MKTFNVIMSEQCNLNCSYCGMDKKTKNKIDPNLFIDEVKKLRSENPEEVIKLDFFGGEPLIQFSMIKQILKEFSGKDNMKFFMPTNGLLLTRDKLDYLNEHNVDISLSFDGLWQDTNRQQFTGKGTLIKYLTNKDLYKGLKCHTMIGKGNFNLLENHLFIMDKFGINPDLTLVRDIDTWDSESVVKLKNGITEMFEWYINNPTEEIPNFILFYLRHFILYHSKGIEVKGCGAGKDILMYAEDRVMPCVRFKDSPEMVEKIPEFYNMKECQKCEVRYYCKKGCLFEQIKNEGPIVELCDIYKHTYKEVSNMVSNLRDTISFKNIISEEIQNA